MIKHTVMWKLNENTSLEDVKRLKELSNTLKSIKSVIDVDFEVYPLETSTFDMMLVSTHNSIEELQAYQKDPIHINFGSELKKLVCQRVAFDYEF